MTQLKTGRPTRREKAILAVQEDKETIRANFILDKALHKQMKQFALDSNMTVTQLIKAAVSEYMSKYAGK